MDAFVNKKMSAEQNDSDLLDFCIDAFHPFTIVEESSKRSQWWTICITTDLWTSRVTESYIAITGHYLTQELEFKTVLLGCCNFPGSHTALNIAAELNAILNKWNLKDKVNFAVSYNGPNIVQAIKDHLEIKHFGCFAHTLNLIVENALKLQQPLLDKIKKIVGHFRRSTVSSERLTKYQIQQNLQPKRLVQHVETRWNSVFIQTWYVTSHGTRVTSWPI